MPFSVIIPTMQRSPMLWPFVEQLCSTNDVDEVLIINNAPARLTFVNRKVRVLDQPENLYVNPSWNLGVSIARSKYICIANDDLAFDMQLCAAPFSSFDSRSGFSHQLRSVSSMSSAACSPATTPRPAASMHDPYTVAPKDSAR